MNPILGNTRRPDLRVSSDGRIDISARIARALSIRKGDIIDVITDGTEYWLRVSLRADRASGRHEARCYPTGRRSNHFRASSRRLASALLCACSARRSAAIPAGDPVPDAAADPSNTLIPLITRSPISAE